MTAPLWVDPHGADIVEPLEVAPYDQDLADAAQERYERQIGWTHD